MNQIDKYIKAKRIGLSDSIQNCKIIYLDTNYWIKLREQNNCKKPQEKILLNKIIELVDSNKCIFPISEVTFWEILKQNDITTLKQSSNMIDRLSKGISIINESERRHLEFAHYVRNNTGKETYDLKQLVWTKISFTVLYDLLPQLKSVELQKSFIDFISNFSFTDIILQIETFGKLIPFSHKDNIQFLNDSKEKYKDENRSFKQLYLSELAGCLDLFENSLNETMSHLYFWDNGVFPTEEERKQDSKLVKNCIYNLCKKNKLINELPTFRIAPELFAAVRWNTDRKYSDGNDITDFLHATVALPYCDYFFY